MLRKESEAVLESNGPVPQQGKFGSGEPALADVYRMFKERFNRWDRTLEKLSGEMRVTSQRVSSLEQDAWQPRLAIQADGQANTKTRERTEGAATAVQAKHGDSCFATRVDPDPMCSISFGDDCTGPPAPPCSGENTLVDNGAAAPESCLPFLEVRSPTATGGLLPTGEASIATRTTHNQPPLRLYSTEETNSKRSTPYVSYDCIFSQMNNLPAAPSCRRVIETKSGKSRMFNRGGSWSSKRLPVFGIVARVALWRGSC